MDYYVEFPKLGWKFFMDPEIHITSTFSIRWYGVLICFAFILCIVLGLLSCKKNGIESNDLLDYILVTIPSAIIGARLYYVAFTWEYYSAHPAEIVQIWNGGLAIYGGIIGAAIGLIIMSKVKKQPALKIIDFIIPYVALGQGIGRWGNFINQEAYGGATDLPWGMTGSVIQQEFGSTLVHPTFFYESMWCFITFAVLMILRGKLKKHGQSLCVYCIMYGTERAFVEGLRTDSLYWGSVRVSQALSIILIVLAVAALIIISVVSKKKDEIIR